MKKIIAILIIIALTAFISSFITRLYVHNQINNPTLKKKEMVEMMNLVYDELELKNEQIEKFNYVTGVFHKKEKQIISEIKEINEMYYTEFIKEQPDSTILRDLAENYGEKQTHLKELTAWYYNETSKFLLKDQLIKLKKIYIEALKISKKNKK